MSESIWNKIKEKMNDHSYMGEIDRDEYRIKATAEVFTPTDLVIKMIKKCGVDKFAPGKTVLDPACGDGQFLVAIKWVKVLFHSMTEENALNDIYGIDLMRDNVDLCKKRLGGGMILMGDSMNPEKRINGQSHYEQLQMVKLFSSSTSLEDFMN
jgi:2-polyprenyl-3-methyl-5-hydroxy-6-metoxy-1,4-benzoquinol methylase